MSRKKNNEELQRYLQIIYGDTSKLSAKTLKLLENTWKTNPLLIVNTANLKLLEATNRNVLSFKRSNAYYDSPEIPVIQRPEINNDNAKVDNRYLGDKSFGEAFNEARKRGLLTFYWKKTKDNPSGIFGVELAKPKDPEEDPVNDIGSGLGDNPKSEAPPINRLFDEVDSIKSKPATLDSLKLLMPTDTTTYNYPEVTIYPEHSYYNNVTPEISLNNISNLKSDKTFWSHPISYPLLRIDLAMNNPDERGATFGGLPITYVYNMMSTPNENGLSFLGHPISTLMNSFYNAMTGKDEDGQSFISHPLSYTYKQLFTKKINKQLLGGIMNKYQLGGTTPQQQLEEDFIKYLVEDAANQGYEITSLQELEAYVLLLGEDGITAKYLEYLLTKQGRALIARLGAKLNYYKQIKGDCPEGQELVFFKKGGKTCKACLKKKNGAALKEPKKGNAVSEFKKTRKAQEGTKTKKLVEKPKLKINENDTVHIPTPNGYEVRSLLNWDGTPMAPGYPIYDNKLYLLDLLRSKMNVPGANARVMKSDLFGNEGDYSGYQSKKK